MIFDKTKIIDAIDSIKQQEFDFSRKNFKTLRNYLEDYLSGYENEDNRNLVLMLCICNLFEKDKIRNTGKTREKLTELARFFSSGDVIEIIEKVSGVELAELKKEKESIEKINFIEQEDEIYNFRELSLQTLINDRRNSPKKDFVIAEKYEEIGNKQKAIEYYTKSAEKGLAEAQYELATFYYSGDGIYKDYHKAFELTLKAAMQGHYLAQFHAGDSYYNGYGVKKNYTDAFYWLKNAVVGISDLGKPHYLLAECFFYGHGVSENKEEAFKYYKFSSETGYVPGIAKLALCYEKGYGTTKNERKAVSLYKKIKYRYDFPAWATYELGHMYFWGNGCYENEKKGFDLMEEAADLGCSEAEEEIKELTERVRTEYGTKTVYAKKGLYTTTISMTGPCSWKLQLNKYTVKIDRIRNESYCKTSTLKLILWYTKEPYKGGRMNGYEMGSTIISQYGLERDFYERNISATLRCTGNPPSGSYYQTLTINELDDDGSWYIVTHINFYGTVYWNKQYR